MTFDSQQSDSRKNALLAPTTWFVAILGARACAFWLIGLVALGDVYSRLVLPSDVRATAGEGFPHVQFTGQAQS